MTGPKNKRFIADKIFFVYRLHTNLQDSVWRGTLRMRSRNPPESIGRILKTESVNNVPHLQLRTLGVSCQLTKLQINLFSLMPSESGGYQQEHQNVSYRLIEWRKSVVYAFTGRLPVVHVPRLSLLASEDYETAALAHFADIISLTMSGSRS
jgi:hypothetical protein